MKREVKTSSTCEAIAERMRKRRRALDMTQIVMAEKLGMTQGQLSRYEKGEWKTIGPDVLIKAADVLGVSLDWLVSGDKDESKPSTPVMHSSVETVCA